MDVTVDHGVPGGRQRPAVAPLEHHAAASHGMDVAGEHEMPRAAADHDAGAGEVAHCAPGERDAFAAGDMNGVRRPELPGQPPEPDVARAFEHEERMIRHGEFHLGTLEIAGRQEIEEAVVPIDVVFPGPIDLAQQVERVVSLARPIPVLVVRRRKLDAFPGRVHARHALV